MTPTADILDFWFGPLNESQQVASAKRERWFKKDAGFDAEIAERFANLHRQLHEALSQQLRPDWTDSTLGTLAAIIVLDQFSRNMYRDTPAMFLSDPLARALSYELIALGRDQELPEVMRGFAYMPLMHAERLVDQQRALELFAPFGEAQKFAEAHLRIVARFGRFPHRNAILGRDSTAEELEFLKEPGSSF